MTLLANDNQYLPATTEVETYFHYKKENLLPKDLDTYEKEVNLIKSTPFILEYVTQLGITDINFDGTTLFIEDNVYGFRQAEIQPTYEQVNMFLNRVRNVKNKDFDQAHSSMNAVIGYLRINAVHEKNNTTGHSTSIRLARPYKVVNSLKEIFADVEESLSEELAQLLGIFVKAKIPIIISGETGSGKTELQKLLIGTVAKKNPNEPEGMQIIVVEDTPDSHIKQLYPHDCIRSWVTDEQFTVEDAVREGMRNNPDIFNIAEIRGIEAGATLDAVKTNHGLISTIHSLGAKDSPSRLMPLIRMSPRYANITDSLLGREIVRFFPINIHMVKERKEIDGVMKTVRYPSEIFELTNYSTENGFEGTYLFKSEYEYDDKKSDYFLNRETKPLSSDMIQRIKNERLFHKVPSRFKPTE